MWNKTFLTSHAIERFFERFAGYAKEQNLHFVQSKMVDTRKTDIWKNGFLPLLNKASENRSFLNNSTFMLSFYEKYGFENKLSFWVAVRVASPKLKIAAVLTVKKKIPESQKPRVLIWEDPGRLRDEKGYFLTDEEKMEKAGFKCPINYKKLVKILLTTVAKDINEGGISIAEDGYFHLQKPVSGYWIEYNVISFSKCSTNLKIEKISKIIG